MFIKTLIPTVILGLVIAFVPFEIPISGSGFSALADGGSENLNRSSVPNTGTSFHAATRSKGIRRHDYRSSKKIKRHDTRRSRGGDGRELTDFRKCMEFLTERSSIKRIYEEIAIREIRIGEYERALAWEEKQNPKKQKRVSRYERIIKGAKYTIKRLEKLITAKRKIISKRCYRKGPKHRVPVPRRKR